MHILSKGDPKPTDGKIELTTALHTTPYIPHTYSVYIHTPYTYIHVYILAYGMRNPCKQTKVPYEKFCSDNSDVSKDSASPTSRPQLTVQTEFLVLNPIFH